MEELSHLLTGVAGLVGGGGIVGLFWALRYFFKDKRDAEGASETQRLASVATDREYLVTQLRLSLQNEYNAKVEAQALLESARNSVVELRGEVLEFKSKFSSALEENVRLKGDLVQWQQQNKRGA